MGKYSNRLPQLNGQRLLTDGGLETTLCFHDGMELPCFAAFTLLESEDGRDRLRRYFEDYLAIAKQHGTGFVLEAATWRANPDWAGRIGYTLEQLRTFNRESITLLEAIRDQHEAPGQPLVISGCIGPRGDGYVPNALMTADEARAYHSEQINTFAETNADVLTAMTLNYVDEAIGVTRASQAVNMPVVISFTVETDGKLPDGTALCNAIETVDRATNLGPVYYMVNCAHPTHFQHVFGEGEWHKRIRGIRANASCRSHAELDEAEELDEGNPTELGQQYRELMSILPNLRVLGGCCGTDHRHIAAIGDACSEHLHSAA